MLCNKDKGTLYLGDPVTNYNYGAGPVAEMCLETCGADAGCDGKQPSSSQALDKHQLTCTDQCGLRITCWKDITYNGVNYEYTFEVISGSLDNCKKVCGEVGITPSGIQVQTNSGYYAPIDGYNNYLTYNEEISRIENGNICTFKLLY